MTFPIFLISEVLRRSATRQATCYISRFLLTFTLHFTCGEKKTWKSIKKSQNIMSMIVVSSGMDSYLPVDDSLVYSLPKTFGQVEFSKITEKFSLISMFLFCALCPKTKTRK